MMRTRLALGLYRCLLAFYPRDFRNEFEIEMKAVFTQALVDRRASMLRLLWRELRDGPRAVWNAHRAERRKIMISTNPTPTIPVPNPDISWKAAWMAALAFLFYFLVPLSAIVIYSLVRLMGFHPFVASDNSRDLLWAFIPMFVIYLASNIILLRLCGRAGWPRWSFAYLGVMLSYIVFAVFINIRYDGNEKSLAILAPPLLLLVIFLIMILGRWWKGLNAMYRRWGGEWTLMSLMYYCCAPLVLIIPSLEDYSINNILVVVISILGVVAYIRSFTRWQRAVALPAVYLVASLVSLGHPFGNYPGWLQYNTSATFQLRIYWNLAVIIPLLIIAALDLRGYGSQRRQHAGYSRID